ncbi:MAG: hypothetical protein WC657_09220, partial [Candidatus Paceibacterota bacterium]
ECALKILIWPRNGLFFWRAQESATLFVETLKNHFGDSEAARRAIASESASEKGSTKSVVYHAGYLHAVGGGDGRVSALAGRPGGLPQSRRHRLGTGKGDGSCSSLSALSKAAVRGSSKSAPPEGGGISSKNATAGFVDGWMQLRRS